MIRYQSQKQLSLTEFEWPFQTALDENNRWVKLSECIPWDELAQAYYQGLSESQGRPTKDARLVIGAVIIKHKLCLSDRETVAQIQENPYLQYFVGLPGYQKGTPFVPSLFVEIRKRMGACVFDAFQEAIVDSLNRRNRSPDTETKSDDDDGNDPAPPGPKEPLPASEGAVEKEEEKSRHRDNQGKVILDATVAPQAIRYPTDLSLLNEGREFSERIIDELYARSEWKRKPRTYREKARKAFLAVAKQRRPGLKVRRRAIKQQLQYLGRNLGHIERLLDCWPEFGPSPLPRWLLHRYWVIQHVYAQQLEMHRNRSRRCDDRIVSISQPYVRPIVRGKLDKPVEFGSKLSVSLDGDGLAHVDHLRWDAFHEGGDLLSQVENFRKRHGHYPEVVLGDPVYGTRENRRYLKSHGIRFAGKPLGRPPKQTETNKEELKRVKAKRREEYLQRIPIEGKFGQGKNGYRLHYIRAKRADTSFSWINSIFLVMNLLILMRLSFVLWKKCLARVTLTILGSFNTLCWSRVIRRRSERYPVIGLPGFAT